MGADDVPERDRVGEDARGARHLTPACRFPVAPFVLATVTTPRARSTTVQYMLLIHDDPNAWAGMSEEQVNAVMGEYFAYSAAIRDEGIFVDGQPLQGRDAAHTVRVRDGERIVADGPFAETKEIVGGYYVIDCETLDQALDAAARIPSARFGAIEVRPIAEM
ncbi:MAG TPA: YciI family protein [Gaiellales bacterium]|nr:YciI family protein [Gaiellales bacterium]